MITTSQRNRGADVNGMVRVARRGIGGSFLAILLSILLSILWWAVPVQAQATDPTQVDSGQADTALLMSQSLETPVPPFVPGEVLVGLQEDAAAAGDAAATVDAAIWGAVSPTRIEPLDLRGAEGVVGYRLYVEPGTEWAAVEQLRDAPEVVFAEVDWLASIAQSPQSDAALDLPDAVTLDAATGAIESPLHIGDRLYGEQWYLQRIGLARSWQVAFGGGSLHTVEVAVIDTGVDFAHPDLVDRLLPGRNYLSPGTAPSDDNGHGTHITGLIAATANSRGMVGAGWQVTVLPLKALDAAGFGPISSIAQAIRDAADAGVEIINLSLQIPADYFVVRSAVNYAASQGVLLIAAAGNCPNFIDCPIPVRYPAAYDDVMGIAATTYYDVQAWYSAEGNGIDLAAPGGGSGLSLLSTWSSLASARCSAGLRQVDGGLYCNSDGTSMAAAVATGAAALVWGMDGDLSAVQVREILQNSAVPIGGSDEEVGAGRLDLAWAAHYAVRPQAQLSLSSVKVSAQAGAAPIEFPITLQNPSLEPISWLITPTVTNNWYGVTGDATGSVRYGVPVDATLVLTPSNVGIAQHLGQYWVRSVTASGTQVNQPVYVDLTVYTQTVTSRIFAPLVPNNYEAGGWAQPSYTPRTAYSIGSNGSLALTLPFTMTIGGRQYTDLSVGSDGIVSLPAISTPPSLPARCLANNISYGMLVYGWWSDLSLNALGARISTFQPDPTRFVIEYAQMAVVGSSERVTFQVVLHADGQVELNYADVPEGIANTNAVVGVSTQEGRFYNQIACWTASIKVGTLPESHQSLIIHPEELY